MDTTTPPDVQTILILKADRLYAQLLRKLTLRIFPAANVITSSSLVSARLAIATQPIDLLITGICASLGGDALELLSGETPGVPPPRRVLVVTSHHEYRVFTVLRALSIDGVFDSSDDAPDAFTNALKAVASGGRYWSPSVAQYLAKAATSSTALFRLLTIFEEVVLSIIGAGCDDVVAARELGLCPSTITTVRRKLHRKLGVQQRGDLVRVAAQNGFVRFTPAGVVRPGFTLLRAAYQTRRPKRSVARPST